MVCHRMTGKSRINNCGLLTHQLFFIRVEFSRLDGLVHFAHEIYLLCSASRPTSPSVSPVQLQECSLVKLLLYLLPRPTAAGNSPVFYFEGRFYCLSVCTTEGDLIFLYWVYEC